MQSYPKLTGVMQATTMGGAKLEKRYSPSFRDDDPTVVAATAAAAAAASASGGGIVGVVGGVNSNSAGAGRKMSAAKRKRDETLRLVHTQHYTLNNRMPTINCHNLAAFRSLIVMSMLCHTNTTVLIGLYLLNYTRNKCAHTQHANTHTNIEKVRTPSASFDRKKTFE